MFTSLPSSSPSGRKNMSDISAQLGISISTVSRALRNADGVDTQTRARVMAEAERLGYAMGNRVPNLRSKPRTLLFLSLGYAGVTESGILAGMSRAAVAQNLSIVAHQISPGEMECILDPKHQPPAMRMGQVDGILLALGWSKRVVGELLRRHSLVSVLEHYENCDFVGMDLSDALAKLTAELPGPGPVFFSLSADRSQIWREACMAAGIRMEKEWGVERIVAGVENWEERVGELVKSGAESWICDSSADAKALANWLQKSHACPQCKLAMVQPGPPVGIEGNILRIGLDPEDVGIAAVRRLARRIESPDEPVRRILLGAGAIRTEVML